MVRRLNLLPVRVSVRRESKAGEEIGMALRDMATDRMQSAMVRKAKRTSPCNNSEMTHELPSNGALAQFVVGQSGESRRQRGEGVGSLLPAWFQVRWKLRGKSGGSGEGGEGAGSRGRRERLNCDFV